jgi:uncharacterized repeat protein (TIGR02543 family)
MTTITMDSDKAVTANFTANPVCYSLSLNSNPSNGGGIGYNPAPNCGYDYTAGTSVYLAAHGNPGYSFNNWSGDAKGSSSTTTITMNGNRSVTANFIPIVNDDLSSAKVIAVIPYSDSTDTTNATTAGDDPLFACGNQSRGSASVWYRFTPNRKGRLSANTIGSNYDTMLAIWQGTRGNLANVACDDDSGGNATSALQVNLNGGTTYYIEIVRYTAGLAPSKPVKLPTGGGGALYLRITFSGNDFYLPYIRR